MNLQMLNQDEMKKIKGGKFDSTTSIKLYTSEDHYAVTLAQGVNPAPYGTLVTISVDLRKGTLYLLPSLGLMAKIS